MKKATKLNTILSNAKIDYSSLMYLNIYNIYNLAKFLKDELSNDEISEMEKAKNLSIKVRKCIDSDPYYYYHVYFMEIMDGEDYITNIEKKEVYPLRNEYYHDWDDCPWEI
jgi:hypothetical protein